MDSIVSVRAQQSAPSGRAPTLCGGHPGRWACPCYKKSAVGRCRPSPTEQGRRGHADIAHCRLAAHPIASRRHCRSAAHRYNIAGGYWLASAASWCRYCSSRLRYRRTSSHRALMMPRKSLGLLLWVYVCLGWPGRPSSTKCYTQCRLFRCIAGRRGRHSPVRIGLHTLGLAGD